MQPLCIALNRHSIEGNTFSLNKYCYPHAQYCTVKSLIIYSQWTILDIILLCMSISSHNQLLFSCKRALFNCPDAICIVSQRCIRVSDTWPNIRILNIYSNIRFLLFISKYSNIPFSSCSNTCDMTFITCWWEIWEIFINQETL